MSALYGIKHELETQDNRITVDPIFIVQQRHRVYGVEAGYRDDYEWLDEDDEYREADDDELKILEEPGASHPPGNWVQTGHKDHWEFVQPFLTERAAQRYIDANAHNLTEPRIYVVSGSSNPEWHALREFFLGKGGAVNWQRLKCALGFHGNLVDYVSVSKGGYDVGTCTRCGRRVYCHYGWKG